MPLHVVTLNTFLDRIWAQSLRAMPYTRSLAMPPSKNLKKKNTKWWWIFVLDVLLSSIPTKRRSYKCLIHLTNRTFPAYILKLSDTGKLTLSWEAPLCTFSNYTLSKLLVRSIYLSIILNSLKSDVKFKFLVLTKH